MGLPINFLFRQKNYDAQLWFALNEEPCFLFITLADPELIQEFSMELSIKTDCEKVLPMHDDYPELNKLRQAIFDSVKTTPEFILMKAKYFSLNKRRKKESPLS